MSAADTYARTADWLSSGQEAAVQVTLEDAREAVQILEKLLDERPCSAYAAKWGETAVVLAIERVAELLVSAHSGLTRSGLGFPR